MSQIRNVQMHITVHRVGEDINIDFPFDTETDNIDQVVGELIENLNLTSEESDEIKAIIRDQVAKTRGEPIISPMPKTTNEPIPNAFDPLSIDDAINEYSDDDVIDDPEYKALLEAQRAEIEALEKKHEKEKRNLCEGAPQSSTADDLIIFS